MTAARLSAVTRGPGTCKQSSSGSENETPSLLMKTCPSIAGSICVVPLANLGTMILSANLEQISAVEARNALASTPTAAPSRTLTAMLSANSRSRCLLRDARRVQQNRKSGPCTKISQRPAVGASRGTDLSGLSGLSGLSSAVCGLTRLCVSGLVSGRNLGAGATRATSPSPFSNCNLASQATHSSRPSLDRRRGVKSFSQDLLSMHQP
mmetsp:Transcript_712/g.1286  ORF Transcript_712/g.1286 Transcript_712/m.1286 type:complete len:209 (-) Transcript_712:128-754(-)